MGRLEARGKTLNEVRSEVRNILIRNGSSPRFQLEIIDFKSQRAYLTVNGVSNVQVLDYQKTSLKDILTAANVGFCVRHHNTRQSDEMVRNIEFRYEVFLTKMRLISSSMMEITILLRTVLLTFYLVKPKSIMMAMWFLQVLEE